MLELYQINLLTIVEITQYSVYVDGGQFGTIVLRDTPDGLEIGDKVEAFAYLDSSDTAVATMAPAKAHVGECVLLEVVSSGKQGTFLDWGLPKDLLLPLSEQVGTVREGESCLVYVTQDDQERPMASMKLHRHLSETSETLREGDAVELLIVSESELGFKAVIDNEVLGLIYHGEIARPLEIGAQMKGWVQAVREDGKINLNINRLDSETRDQLENAILQKLEEHNGRLELSDKSSPEAIYEAFHVSKKNFKRAISGLYKERIIVVSPDYIELAPSPKPRRTLSTR